ncbi:prolipoprotein diacylglyceryl transferase [Roseivirga misakiensis]|uniref:Phosphatidylglycerol--prolipoprotein diacylglyceryl transferase n=1 Tax=Roseivirga misakiensis TaxID=1563681 RepID=A0A1E5T0N4_9BACT|nr:prolipoprotein diacylglyceryl transferase [Roseivirga misakiensis]OEK04867.1 prolipoprotein diacylglyceryl transferase [Roseivirga misakiensis]
MIAHIYWDIDPRVFSNFEFLRWYGTCWLLGMVLGYKIMLMIYKREGLESIELESLATYVMLGGIIGARFGHILFYDPIYYWNNPIEVLPFRLNPTFEFTGLAGLASHGGIIGALLALYLYNRKYKKNYLWILDRLTIAGAALGGFIRLGNLMNSEIIGTPSDLPWAFIFVRVDQVPRHPSQLYEALFYFLICFVLYRLWKTGKYSTNNGFFFGLGMILIFTQRFLVEFLKENQVAFEESLTLNMGQSLSIPLILIGVFFMLRSIKNTQKPPQTA